MEIQLYNYSLDKTFVYEIFQIHTNPLPPPPHVSRKAGQQDTGSPQRPFLRPERLRTSGRFRWGLGGSRIVIS